MARARTTKSLASRIELTYYQRPHPLRSWRGRLSFAAFAIPALLLAGLAFAGDDAVHSPGALVSAHASFADDCAECHTPWRGIAAESCERCHSGAVHAADQAFAPDCASCHREHQGDTPLSRPGDAHCTQCHSGLVTAGGAPSARFEREVASLASHPEFALLRRAAADPGAADPGTVALDHEKHLALEMPGLGRKLACADCHVPDATGRLMQPIRYELHCASCHELGLEGRLAGARVTHGRPIAELRDELRALAAARALDPAVPDRPDAGAPVLSGERARRDALADPTVARWIEDSVAEAERYLVSSRCAECHRLEAAAPIVAPPSIPSRWLEHARFDHESHRAQECTSCHGGVPSSTRTADVHVPGIASCRECHGSAGGARGDCALCHTYHPRAR